MTSAEACTILVQLTHDLSATRAERDAYRLLSFAAMAHAAELTRELEVIDERRKLREQRDRAA